MTDARLATSDPLVGQTVAGHRLEAVLGRGGQAVVYRAHDLHLERPVALKLVTAAALGADPGLAARFRREVDLVKRLEHPNIVRLYDFGQTDAGVPWMTMELLAGQTLRERLARDGALPLAVARELALQILEGLAIAHDEGIVHRDLKPENVVLVRQGVSDELAKILDFGVGRALNSDDGSDTAQHPVEGLQATPRYMAPELLLGVPSSAATDIYSVGLLLCEMLTGTPAVDGADTAEVLARIAAGQIALPAELEGTPLGAVLACALAPEPLDRFPDAAAMHAALRAASAGAEPAVAVPTAEPDAFAVLPSSALPSQIHAARAASVEAARASFGALWGLALALLVLVIGAAFVLTSPADDQAGAAASDAAAATPGEPAGDALRIGVPPITDADVMLDELEPLRQWLGQRLGRPVELVTSESYDAMAQRVVDGELAVGLFPPMLYVTTSERVMPGTLRPLAIEAFDGASSSDAYLLVDERAPLATLEDLRGRSFCFTDPSSTTGHLLPRHWLERQGLDPDAFVGRVHWSGSHLQVMRDLLDGRCEVAATYSGAYFSARDHDIPIGRMRIFAVIGRSPQTAWVAGPGTDAASGAALERALLAFDPVRELGRARLGDTLRITGFSPADPRTWETLRDIARGLRDVDTAAVE